LAALVLFRVSGGDSAELARLLAKAGYPVLQAEQGSSTLIGAVGPRIMFGSPGRLMTLALSSGSSAGSA
jgi:hypothetical protein